MSLDPWFQISVKEVKTNIRMIKYPFAKANCNTFNTSGCCDVAAFVEESKDALAGRDLLIIEQSD